MRSARLCIAAACALVPKKYHGMPPAQAYRILLICFLDITLAGLLGSLAQLCSLEIQLLHALEAALQLPWQSCSACMTAKPA